MATNELINLNFIYPDGSDIRCTSMPGQSLYQIAIKNDIQMDDKHPKTCLVQIQNSKDIDANFYEFKIQDPTHREVRELNANQLNLGFRFADDYIVDESLSNALIFLNLVRVYYTDRTGKQYQLQAYVNESMLSLRERKQSIIDLSFACHGALACSTCHCIFDVTDDLFKSLGEITEDEENLLQFANPGKYSRLGCQVHAIEQGFDNKLYFHNPRSKIHV